MKNGNDKKDRQVEIPAGTTTRFVGFITVDGYLCNSREEAIEYNKEMRD